MNNEAICIKAVNGIIGNSEDLIILKLFCRYKYYYEQDYFCNGRKFKEVIMIKDELYLDKRAKEPYAMNQEKFEEYFVLLK